jgi:transcription elongation factor B subunit 1
MLINSLCPYAGTFTEQAMGEINFREISTPILEKVIQYFYYKLRYTNSTTEIPEFPIEPEVALELLMAANFLVRTRPPSQIHAT